MAEGNQAQKRNLAAEAFRKSYSALHDALALPDVASRLTTKLYGGAIITLETRDAIQITGITPAQQASRLLQAVESSIRIDYKRLRKFTRLLKKQPVLSPIAEELRQCYRDLVSKAILAESSSSGSDTEQHQPQESSTSTLSPGQNSAASPSLQASQSSNPTQPPISPSCRRRHLTSPSITNPRHSSGTPRRSVSLSFPKSPTSNPPKVFANGDNDWTSQVDTKTVQSYNERSGQSTEERSVSPKLSREETKTKTVFKNTGNITRNSPYVDWNCRLIKKSDASSQDVTASGVLVKLDYPPEELHTRLPGLRPMETCKEYGSVQTRYMLITCHHTIPGMSYLNGWRLVVGLGKTPKTFNRLQDLVCGAVSCCGENGFISSGPLQPTEKAPVFSSHLNKRCCLGLDFTILFLNQAIEKFVSNRRGVQTKPVDINLKFLKAETYEHLQLYQHEQPITEVRISPSVGIKPHDILVSTLKDEICVYKTLQVVQYTQSERQITQFCSGSPLVHGYETLVGIHVEGDAGSGAGVTIYGIFQLLKGELAAFFALMEKSDARRKWPFRWAHLLDCTLVGLKKEPLNYLLEVLHHLLINMSGVCIIELQVSDPMLKLKSGLELLSTLFKQFERHGCERVAEAVSEKIKENQFNKQLEPLSIFLVDFLHYLAELDTPTDADLVKTYFVCYNWVFNFECTGQFEAVLSKNIDAVTKDLQRLQRMYQSRDDLASVNCSEIQLQLMKCKYEFPIQQLKAQIQQLEEKLQQELQQTKCTYISKIKQLEEEFRQELQQAKCTYEPQIQQLKDQLQKLQHEIMKPVS